MYNNILSNKLDNDNIVNNNNDVHTNQLVPNGRITLKRKCNEDANKKMNNMNTKIVDPLDRKRMKIDKSSAISENNNINKINKTSVDVTPEKVFNDNSLLNKSSLSENINKMNKTSDDVTSEKEFDDMSKNVFAKSMSGELYIVK